MADTRSFTGGQFAFMADGSEFLGFVKKVSGGTAKAEVATHNLGPSLLQKKHISTISFEDITCEVGLGMAKAMYEWIQATFDQGTVSKSGEIHACNAEGSSMAVREYRDALITEVAMPALDGSSKEPAYMTLKISPEEIKYLPGTGAKIEGKIAPATKKWLCSNFRIDLGKLPCARVSKIDAWTWKAKTTKDEVGQFRIATKHVSAVEVPNLKLTISTADIKDWQDWHKSFLIDGNCSETDELSGSITFLSPNLKEELGRVELQNVGMVSMENEGFEANKEGVSRFTVELYVEQMKFHIEESDA